MGVDRRAPRRLEPEALFFPDGRRLGRDVRRFGEARSHRRSADRRASALLGLRDGPWKFIYEIESGQSWLFDLSADPVEKHDLSAMEPERARVYRDHLLRWSAAQKFLIQRGGS